LFNAFVLGRTGKVAGLLVGCGLAALSALFYLRAEGPEGEPPTQQSLGTTRDIFQAHCATCHGVAGDGSGKTARLLGFKMQDFRDCSSMSRFSDEVLFSIIRDGAAPFGRSAAMAGWKQTLSDQQMWEMVRYVRSFCRTQPSPSGKPLSDERAPAGRP
jgi:mono/diheme cytochrome c family protein